MKETYKKEICVDVMFTKRENGKTKVLLVNKKEIDVDNYQFPEGHIQNNEDIIEAIKREINTELAFDISCKDLKLVHIMYSCPKDKIIFIFKSTRKVEPNKKRLNKYKDFMWAEMDKLPFQTTLEVRKIIKNIIERKFYDSI